MKNFVLAIVISVVLLTIQGAGSVWSNSMRPRPELAYGTPTGDYTVHTGYVAGRTSHFTPWVIEHLTSTSFAKRATRDGLDFVSDPDVPREFRASNRDYAASGYDRGHLAPADDMTADPLAMRDCFLLSNMMPQTPQLNRGQWRALENHVRELAKRDGAEVWSITGPAWLADEDGKISFEAIGSHQVWAPTHCWKAVLVKRGKRLDAHAWLMPNVAEPPVFDECLSTIDEIEAVAGLDLFDGLDDDLEEALEANAT